MDIKYFAMAVLCAIMGALKLFRDKDYYKALLMFGMTMLLMKGL